MLGLAVVSRGDSFAAKRRSLSESCQGEGRHNHHVEVLDPRKAPFVRPASFS